LQDVAADQRIEQRVARELIDIGVSERHILQPRFDHPSLSSIDRARISLDRYDLAGRTYKVTEENRYISNPSANIEDPLPGAKPGFAQESFRDWSKPLGLADETFVFRVRTTEEIISAAARRGHSTVETRTLRDRAAATPFGTLDQILLPGL